MRTVRTHPSLCRSSGTARTAGARIPLRFPLLLKIGRRGAMGQGGVGLWCTRYVYIYIYIYIYIYQYLYLYVYVYTCMHTHTRTHIYVFYRAAVYRVRCIEYAPLIINRRAGGRPCLHIYKCIHTRTHTHTSMFYGAAVDRVV